MRLWILFGCGVLILGAAIWPFGKRPEQLAPAPVPPTVAVKPATPEVPKPQPTKIVEVIDLARAYEPVREPEEPAGGVNPAAFIEVPEAPKPIPPAGELIDVTPREVATIQNGLLNFVPTPDYAAAQIFTPMAIPYTLVPQPIPPNAVIVPTESLKVMPREVIVIQREERERNTGVGEDDFVGLIEPGSVGPVEQLNVMPREVK